MTLEYLNKMRQRCENHVANERFNLNSVYDDIFVQKLVNIQPFNRLTASLIGLVGHRDSAKIIKSLLRFSFFIEPVKKPAIETTKFAVRWSEEFNGDPRFSSYEECLLIFETFFTRLIGELASGDNKRLIKLMVNNTSIAYEIPIDYISRSSNPIHSVNNIAWNFGELPMSVVKLRAFLTDASKHNYASFFRGVYTKIKTKTYLTDRVLTGEHKTNREKRWECHPDSVHFALRKTAWDIELKLIPQVCHFDGFPQDLKQTMIDNEILGFDDVVMKCPITLEPLSFAQLKEEVEDTTHGRSNFQVGHMNPLKSEAEDGISGHTAQNISWISEQGNRIQGSNSVGFIREFIVKIYNNYLAAGYVGH